MDTARRSYLVEFGSSMLAYVVILPLVMAFIARHGDSPWRFAVALLPVVPLCFALAAMLRFFSRIDELARKIHLESFAVAAGVTAIATFAYGMLQNVGLPPINLTLILPFTVLVWGLGTAIASWRYR